MKVWIVVGIVEGEMTEFGVYAHEAQAESEYRKMKDTYDVLGELFMGDCEVIGTPG